MNNNDADNIDHETILMALDQVSQTIEIMTSVVGRLRGYVSEQAERSQGTKSTSDEVAGFAEHTIVSNKYH